jgi:phosphate ABC transporter phosphate-binding protein
MMRRRIATVALAILILGAAPARTALAGSSINGSGSTWSQIAVDQWRADVSRFGLSVNYSGTGSSQGRAFFIANQTDFAVSEIPFEDEELRSLKRQFQYLPIVAGGTSLMYSLKDSGGNQVRDLNLSARSAAGIFTGDITFWDDPAIKADNKKIDLPHNAIVPVVRSDGSGTSAQFSAYISAMEPGTWSRFAKANGINGKYTSYWPQFPGAVGQSGSDGVANFVANRYTGANTITYVEAGYALLRGFPVANLKNRSGRYAQPTAANVAIALQHATFYKDGTQNLGGVYSASEPDAYPMSSYSYMITQTTGFDPAKGQTLGKFIIYFACDGQQSAEALGYSPLPPNLVEAAFQAVEKIPGAPEPPPLSKCNNPTITGRNSPIDYEEAGGGSTGESGDVSGGQQTKRDRVKEGSGGPADGSAEELAQAVEADPMAVLAAAEELGDASSWGLPALATLMLLGVVAGPLFVRRRGS